MNSLSDGDDRRIAALLGNGNDILEGCKFLGRSLPIELHSPFETLDIGYNLSFILQQFWSNRLLFHQNRVAVITHFALLS